MILAVDTSLGTAVALVGADGAVRAEASTANALGHAEVIGELMREVLRAAGDPEVTHVVAGMGPGPFTGLRIGIAAARAFALGRGVEVIPVPSHFAPALAELRAGNPAPFAIVTDARRRELAVSIFDGEDADGIPHLNEPTFLVPRVEVEERLAGIRSVEVTRIAASDLALVAVRALAVSRVLAGPEPLYLRAPDVTLTGTPKRVSA